MAEKSTSTITFSTLRDRNNRALDKELSREHKLNNPALENSRLPEIFDQRTRIEDLASSASQVAFYNRSQGGDWHSEYTRFNSRGDNGNGLWKDSMKERVELWNKVWNSLAGTKYARFQELFSDSIHLSVPTAILSAVETLKKNPDKKLEILTAIRESVRHLKSCLISADRISDNLAQSLKVVNFEKTDKPFDRLQKKAEIDVLNQVKLIFDAARPAARRNNRILVVQEPDKETEALYPGVAKPSSKIIGTIIYTREINPDPNRPSMFPKDFAPRNMIAMHFDSAYAALRKTSHEVRNYDAEIKELSALVAELRKFQKTVYTQWKGADDSYKKSMIEQYKELRDKSEEVLNKCENSFKVKASKLLQGIHTGNDRSNRPGFLDSQGRPNIQPLIVKFGAAHEQLKARSEEMQNIGAFNEKDRLILIGEISKQETLISGFAGKLRTNHRLLNTDVLFKGDNRLSGKKLEGHVKGLMVHLGIDRQDLENIRMRPFTTFKEALEKTTDLLETALRHKYKDEAKEAVIQIHLIKKFFNLSKLVEGLKMDIARPEHINLENLRAFVSSFREEFSSFQVFPDHEISRYKPVFKEFEKNILTLERGLTHYSNTKMSTEEKLAMFEKLKKFLKNIDAEAVVLDLCSR